MSDKEKPQSGVESLLRAIEKLQANALVGTRDSIEINPERTRSFDGLDAEFGHAHSERIA